MYNVEEARKKMANSKACLDAQMRMVENQVDEMLKVGLSNSEITIELEYMINPVMKELANLGYEVKKTHSRGFVIYI